MKFGTKAIHAGLEPDKSTGAIMTPIYQTSTYVQAAPGDHKGYEYSRTLNPTRDALQKNLAALENAKHALTFGSGMAAADTFMRIFKAGDEIISTNDLYGGSYRLFTKVYTQYDIKFTFAPLNNVEYIESHITENTKMLWVETPTNPTCQIIDIKAMSAVAKKHGLLLVVDNTFASPYLQNPLDLGADVVLHSITKYIGGHSDVVMGALMLNNDELAEKLFFLQNTCGAVPGPMDCFLVLRGIKTLHLRMRQHCINGKEVAHFLANHPKVAKVLWPGFESHPNHKIAKSQMRDYGGMLSFSLKGDKMEDALKFMQSTKLFALAESLGGVESLLGHPASMTHAAIPIDVRKAAGVDDTLIRLSVGVEDIEDLLEDLENALSVI
ncbi:MAG: cystathionine gamma-lyase [Sphingobacteriales bacterium]|jgi:cystathionine gamma-lyase